MTIGEGSVRLWVLALVLAGGVAHPAASSGQSTGLAIRNVTVVDITDGSLLREHTVLIEGNRIVEMGRVQDLAIPAHAEIVEAAGTYLIPGLWDLHAHALSSYREVVPFFNALLANGVMGIRDPQHSSLELQAMVAPATRAGVLPGPVRMIVAGNLVDGPPRGWPGSQVADSPERGRAVVDSLARAGAPFIKVYSKLSPETYFAIVERAGEVGLPIVGHVPIGVSPAAASDAGQRSMEHLVGGVMLGCTSEEDAALSDVNALAAAVARGDTTVAPNAAVGRYMAALLAPFDEGRCRALLARFAANETWQVPTLVASWAFAMASDSAIAEDLRTRYMPRDGALSYWHDYFPRIPPQALEWYERQRRIAGLLEEQGVPLLVGSDMPAVPMVYPGFSIHDEMRLLVETGLSPLYVLQGATLNPARFFGMTDSLGTVEAGRLADLVLLDANPLENIANTQRIRAVVANGRLYREDRLGALLDEAAAISTRRSLAAILRETLDEEGLEVARAQYLALAAAAPDTVSFSEWELTALALLLVDQGRKDEALDVFAWNVQAFPGSPYVRGSFADALTRMERWDAAERMYDEAVRIARALGHPSLDHFVRRRAGVLDSAGREVPTAAPDQDLAPALPAASAATSDTVHVAPPTGDSEADRTNVQAAFDTVQPGGTVRFAPGTYLLGAGARITVPDVTVLGHPDGTVLRGCDPEAFTVEYSRVESVVFGCTGLYVQAERQTIRGLTFEYTWHGIVVGPYPTTVEEATALGESGELPPAYPAGGQRIEGNTFRATPNGLRVLGTGDQMSVVRDNLFIDVFHAIGIYGAPLHFLDNRLTVEDPGGVPFSRHPGSAIIVSPMHTDCAGHVVAGNRIDGYPDPIYVLVGRGETCRGVEIRDNTIRAARVKLPEAGGFYKPTEEDSTMVGVPITLMNQTEPIPGLGLPDSDTKGVLEDILVQGNHIVGAEGLGILVQGVSRSRIAGNTIAGIHRRTPFPGITWDGFEQRWEAANGSAIWISAGSDENEIVGNAFEDIASAALFLEGDHNTVDARSVDDAVRDLGIGNRVRVTDGAVRERGSETPGAAELLAPAHESRFVAAGGVRLHYLDFGGEGLPIIFTAGSRSAEAWAGFAPRFTDRHRVLAITDRGVPPSEGEQSGFVGRAGDILALLDTLGIERAVLVANSNPAQILIYLAEHHPERLAGLVFLAPDSEAGLDSVEDPSGAMLMVERALLSAQDRDPDEAGTWGEEDLYRPRYLAADTAAIAVPALTFVNLEGTRGLERSYYPLEVADLVASGALVIPDSAARTYFERLAADEAMQVEVRAAWDGTFVPVFRANEQAFFRAFGDHLRVVRLDVPLMNGVPVVTGYEYRDAPELVEAHVRRFLEEVAGVEAARPPAPPPGSQRRE